VAPSQLKLLLSSEVECYFGYKIDVVQLLSQVRNKSEHSIKIFWLIS